MKMGHCPTMQQLQDFAIGLLDKSASATIEEHVLRCDVCCDHLENVSEVDPIIETLREQWIRPAFAISPEVIPIQRQLHASYQQISTKLSLYQGNTAVVPLKRHLDQDVQSAPNVTEPSSDVLPEQIGHYVLKEKLGTGGTGVVYRAWDSRLCRQVAIKIILDRRQANPLHLKRFTAEASTLARLTHPQIVQIHEVGENAGRAYLVLEYLPGGDLAALLRGEPQHPEDSASLVAQLARAVHHAHAHGIIHRDLKPSNLLLEHPLDTTNAIPARPLKNLHCKIADFGLAKQMEVPGTTESGTVLGTPGYLAPESLLKDPEENQHAQALDVYSLGAILYELLTGRPPFRGETVAETLVQIQTELPLPPRKLRPRLSRELETICMHCLEKDPRQRYPTAEQLADDLERYLHHEPITVRPANLLQRGIKWARRKPALAALFILFFVSFALLAAGAILYERRLHAALLKTEWERDRADTSYRRAREALEGMLKKLDDPRRANVPQLQALRREQQQEIVQFLQTVTANASNDPKIMRDVAKALYTSGRLRIVLGELEPARQDLQRANGLLTTLQHQSPEDVMLPLERASTLQALAMTFPLGSSSNLGLNEEVLELQSKVLLQQAENQEIKRHVAITLHNLGSNYINLKQFDRAEDYLLKSISMVEQLQPEGHQALQVELAETEVNLSLVYQSSGKTDLAEKYYVRALHRFEEILRKDSQDIRVQISLSGLRVNRANALAVRGSMTEALALLDLNLKELQSLLQREPDYRDVKERLLETQGSRGNILGLQKRHREAAAAFLDVVRFSDPSMASYYQLFVASNWAMAGEYRPSLEACRQAAQCTELNYEQKAYLAMTYCRNAALILKDDSLSSAEKASQSQQSSEQAVRWLLEAKKQAGEIPWKQFKKSLTIDAMWAPIRDHQPAWDWVKQS